MAASPPEPGAGMGLYGSWAVLLVFGLLVDWPWWVKSSVVALPVLAILWLVGLHRKPTVRPHPTQAGRR